MELSGSSSNVLLTNGYVIQFAFKLTKDSEDVSRPCYYLAERCVRHFILPFNPSYQTFELFYHFDSSAKAEVEMSASLLRRDGNVYIRFFESDFDPSVAPKGIAIRINREFFFNGVLKIDGCKVLVQHVDGIPYYFPDRPCDKFRLECMEQWQNRGVA